MSVTITVHCDRPECPTELEVQQAELSWAIAEAATFGWGITVRPGRPVKTICPEHDRSPMPRGRNEWSAVTP